MADQPSWLAIDPRGSLFVIPAAGSTITHIALDSGCVWGNQLTAVRLEDRAVFQVDAVEK